MTMRNYKYYLFDLDRTLWDFNKNSKCAIFKLIDKYNLGNLLGINDKEKFFNTYDKVNHYLWSKYEANEITKEYLRAARFFTVFEDYIKSKEWSLEKLQQFSEKFAEDYLNQMTFETELEPNALEVLKTLKERGAKIAIITNGFKDVQYRKLSNSNILHYMDAIIVSEEVGVHKPSPIIFRKAIEAICHSDEYNTNRIEVKRNTLMIGDDFTNDIEGAQVFGIDQFYYNPIHKPCDGAPTYESDNLIDIVYPQ